MDAASPSRRAFLFGAAPAGARAYATIDDSLCLAHRGIACQSCRDACDVAAIGFPARRGVPQPRVDAARCTGCGDCVGVCPAAAIVCTRRVPA